MNEQKMATIYVLELNNGKYYVGKTTDKISRLDTHFTSGGSAWTRKYKPKKVIETMEMCDSFDEDKYTLKYMEKYGINNVRGGTFTQINLTELNIDLISKMLKTSNNQCYVCGSKEHFIKDCDVNNNNKEEKKKYELDGKCDCINSYFSSHRKSKCALNKTIKFVSEIFDNESNDVVKLKQLKFDNTDNTTNETKIMTMETNETLTQKHNDGKTNNNKIICYRCGRKNHYKTQCYAKTHIKGHSLS